MMYKNDKDQIQTEWVVLRPDVSWLKGDRSSYSGEIIIKDWLGGTKKAYHMVKGKAMLPAQVNGKVNTTMETTCIKYAYNRRVECAASTSALKPGQDKTNIIVVKASACYERVEFFECTTVNDYTVDHFTIDPEVDMFAGATDAEDYVPVTNCGEEFGIPCTGLEDNPLPATYVDPYPNLFSRIVALGSALNLDEGTQQFLWDNPFMVSEAESGVYEYTADSEPLDDVKTGILAAQVVAQSSLAPDDWDDVIAAAIDVILPGTYPFTKGTVIPYIKAQYVLELDKDPGLATETWPIPFSAAPYPVGRINAAYRAVKEFMHMGLAVAGLVPLIGDICDLTDGMLYSLEGDWGNASLSLASSIPFAGVIPATARIIKVGHEMKAFKMVDGMWHFTRNSAKWRQALGIAGNSSYIGHHIIPLSLETETIVQKATPGAIRRILRRYKID
jgi:hypothetical protein